MIPRLAALALVAVSLMSAEVYELRTYYCLPGRLDALNARFKNHTMKLFEKHGMVNVGYWVPQDEPEKGPKKSNTLIYVIKHKSRDAAKASWDAFRKDPVWMAARDASEKDGKIVERVESVYMDAVPYSPMK
ncbi:MAG: NIPSNAP family protein [Acidobacteria bacterium]|nr:NIPSNAP family protein [Acidobacteriota bacterium]